MRMSASPKVFFFTDFGSAGPYTGLMEAALLEHCPSARVIQLQADAPSCNPRRAGRLLAALLPWLPAGAMVVAVVDPGVGSDRRALLVEQGGRYLVGPDNGLFAWIINQPDCRVRELRLQQAPASASFHGRDLFAPAAGLWLAGRLPEYPELAVSELVGYDWPKELREIIYIDEFGNAMTGCSARGLEADVRFEVAGRVATRRRTFSEAEAGELFWYANSLGLVEFAVNRGRADRIPGIREGAAVTRIPAAS